MGKNDLQEQLDAVNGELASTSSALAKANTELEAANATIEELKTALSERNDALVKANAELDAANAALAAASKIPQEVKTVKINPKAEKPSLEGTDFEFGGKKYRFKVAKFRIPAVNDGQPITAAEAAVTPEALKYLVENQCAVIEEIA